MVATQRPAVPEVMPLVNAYYAFTDCGVGGSLHIVLDDKNIEDTHIQFCIQCAQDPEFWVAKHYGGHDEAGELLGRILLLMSHTQRSKLATAHDGYRQGHSCDRPAFIAKCRSILAQYAT